MRTTSPQNFAIGSKLTKLHEIRQPRAGFPARHRKDSAMYTVFEIDYNNRCYKIGTAETLKEACALERKALRKSHGEFPTFSSDGTKCVTNNAKPIE